MWKNVLEGSAGSPAEELSLPTWRRIMLHAGLVFFVLYPDFRLPPLRRILLEGGLLLALLLTSSWLVRG